VLVVALVAQLAITANGPDTGSACMPIHLTAALRVPGRATVAIDPPRGPGIQLLRSRMATRVEPDGSGTLSTIVEASALVTTGLTGRVQLPPFVATVDGRRVESSPFVVELHAPIEPAPVVIVRAQLENLPPGTTIDSLIVGQQVDYTVDVLLNEPARNRLRRNPTFFPPEMAAVLAYDVRLPPGVPRQGRRCFETLSYRRAIFPLFPGRVAIPPAVLTYSLPLSSSFFSREESFEVRTDSVLFGAVEPPLRDRPRDFTGAVGSLRISAKLQSPSARVGDPVVLTARVDAVGNVKLLPRPALSLPWATVTEGEERVRLDSGTSRISGSKEYDWIVAPRVAGTQTIPGIRYVYFDPATSRYDVAATTPLTLNVGAGTLAPSDTVLGPRLPVRVVMRPELGAPLGSRPIYWALLVLAPIPAVVRRVVRRRRWRARELSPVKRLRLLASSRVPPSAPELRRLFLDALRERIPSVGRDHDPLARVLRRAGVSDATALEAEELLARLDDAAYSPGGELEPSALRDAAEIAETVHREAMPSHAAARALTGSSVLLFVASAAMLAAPDAAEKSFAEGVQAYQRGQFAIAERRFQRATADAPRAVDAWANLGSSAWESADSAQASRAWHHALRLDPLDDEARERLAGVQLLGPRSAAYVPPVSADLLAVSALGLWLIAWIVLALPERWRTGPARRLAGGSIVVSLAALVALIEVNGRLEARDLGVLVHGRALLESPAPDAAMLAPAGAGEAGRLGAREGAWVHLTLDATRAGWVPASSVMPIDPVQPARLTGLAPLR
jgi:tetratricopeptide (TPR) repeat protein